MTDYRTGLFSTAYFPPITYVSAICKSGNVLIEGCETYQKQTYRTRCRINSGDGPLFMCIPIERSTGRGGSIRDVRPDYSKNWIHQHVRALESYYNTTPFFEYYFYDDLLPIYEKRPEFLFDLNMAFLEKILELITPGKTLRITEDYLTAQEAAERGISDFREIIHPKKQLPEGMFEEKEYYQVFSDRHGFVPGLSIIDLLFHEGPAAITYL